MSDLNQRLIQAYHGNKGLHQEQDNYYLGTFRERVVLTATRQQCQEETFARYFPTVLKQVKDTYPNVTVKISAKLPTDKQITLLQASQKEDLSATIIADNTEQSPYGLVIHSDTAENRPEIAIEEVFPEMAIKHHSEQPTAKPNFWQRLFQTAKDKE